MNNISAISSALRSKGFRFHEGSNSFSRGLIVVSLIVDEEENDYFYHIRDDSQSPAKTIYQGRLSPALLIGILEENRITAMFDELRKQTEAREMMGYLQDLVDRGFLLAEKQEIVHSFLRWLLKDGNKPDVTATLYGTNDLNREEFEANTRIAIDEAGGCSVCGDLDGYSCICEPELD